MMPHQVSQRTAVAKENLTRQSNNSGGTGIDLVQFKMHIKYIHVPLGPYPWLILLFLILQNLDYISAPASIQILVVSFDVTV